MNAKQPNKSKIKNKIIFLLLLSVFIIFAGLTIIIYISKFNDLQQEKILQSKIIAQVCVNNITNDFIRYYKEAEKFNLFISNFKDIPSSYRAKYFSDLTKNFLINEPRSTCFWAYLDSRDSSPINTYLIEPPAVNPVFFDAKKIFDVSWFRYNGNILSETAWLFSEAIQEDYFIEPIKQRRTVISDPYLYLYDNFEDELPDSLHSNESFLLVSISSPVFDARNNVIGVTGMDVDIDNLVNFVNSMRSDENTYLSLISQTGTYLSHPYKEYIDQEIQANPLFSEEDAAIILKSIQTGDETDYHIVSAQTGEKYFVSYSLVDIPELKFKMMVSMLTPYSVLAQLSEKLIFNIIICFAIAFILIAGIVFWVSIKFNDAAYLGGMPDTETK